jgi:hypothetical protein
MRLFVTDVTKKTKIRKQQCPHFYQIVSRTCLIFRTPTTVESGTKTGMSQRKYDILCSNNLNDFGSSSKKLQLHK